MTFNIAQFKNRGLTRGGARPSLFHVELTTPPTVGTTTALQKFAFTCRASSIPESVVEAIPVPYFGRQIKLAGDRQFADWSVTVLNDEDYLVRDMFEDWSNQMNTHAGNKLLLPNQEYKSRDALVTHYGKNGERLKKYKFIGIFPISIGQMGLDWEATNQIQTFDVQFAYDYWVPYTGDDQPSLDVGENDLT